MPDLAGIFKVVALGFTHNDACKAGWCGDVIFDTVPDHKREVFTRWVAAHKLRDIVVEAFVVKDLHDVLIDYGIQCLEINQHTGNPVRLSGDRYLDSIIVTVATFVVALSEDGDIFLIG